MGRYVYQDFNNKTVHYHISTRFSHGQTAGNLILSKINMFKCNLSKYILKTSYKHYHISFSPESSHGKAAMPLFYTDSG